MQKLTIHPKKRTFDVMKTISAKQFQLNQSDIMKAAAGGESVLVTFHNKPWVRLEPAHPTAPKPGSKEALEVALKIKFSGTPFQNGSFDTIHREIMRQKHGL